MAVFLGIPWLAQVLGTLFAGIVSWFATFVTRRVALIAAALVAIGSLTAAFVAAQEALIAGIGVAFPAAGTGWNLFVPDNFTGVFATCLSARVLWWVYQWNTKIVQLRLF